jgi:hypothetical protein
LLNLLFSNFNIPRLPFYAIEIDSFRRALLYNLTPICFFWTFID